MEDLLEMLKRRLPPDACGVEVGAHTLPVRGLTPFYLDRVAKFAGTAGKIDVQADALALPLATGRLDYLCSSHVLEHLVNPVMALFEWHRVLRPDGLLYLVVPDKRHTFDEPRTITPPEHIVDDFRNATSVVEIAHLKEFIYDTDWRRLRPDIKPENWAHHQRVFFDAYKDDVSKGNAVDVHCHTFTPDSLMDLMQRVGMAGSASDCFEILGSAERYPPERGDGIGLLLRKKHGRALSPGTQTFCFRREGASSIDLPLVCPATLAPLKATDESDGLKLRVRGYGHAYPVTAGIPTLIHPPGIPVSRPWAASWRRRVWLAGYRLPLVSLC